MIKKLRIKFICIIMTVVTVMLAVMFGLVLHITGDNLEKECERALQQAAGGPAFSMGMRGPEEAGLPYFRIVVDVWGNLRVAGNIDLEAYGEDMIYQLWERVQEQGTPVGEIEELDLRYIQSKGIAEAGYAFVDVSSHTAIMKDLWRSCSGIGAVSFLIFLAISILLARWAVKPVETAWEQQRQFVADASHELKTPLTVILTNAELLQEQGYDEAARRQFSGSILTMSRQMRGLVESLLQLARADSGQSSLEMAVTDYSRLVEDALLPFEPLYFEQGLTLESRVEPGISLMAAARSLSQLVDILLDNGLKYSTPGGVVRLELKNQGRNCLLSVSSPGVALTAKQCRDIFRRFYRVDQARSMNQSYGLGLAIAQRIVADHRGRIWAEGTEGRNTFYVSLPIN